MTAFADRPGSEAAAILVAAGTGERLGAGRPKALVELAGRAMYEWSVIAIAGSARIGALMIAAPPGQEETVADGARSVVELSSGHGQEAEAVPGGQQIEVASGGVGTPGASGGLKVEVVPGGATRAESVGAALRRVGSELVLVHDAARPLVTTQLVDDVLARLVAAGDECGGVIAAAPLTDTVKEAGPGDAPVVRRTLDRDQLWAAQTPQAFPAEILRKAHEKAGEGEAATDDAALVEALGMPVSIHPSPALNFKVTGPQDLELAAHLLAGR